VIIRPATPSDNLGTIWREVYEADYAALMPRGALASFEPRGQAYVADMHNKAIAFCYVHNHWLYELWVSKDWQGRGVGTALIHYAETLMQEHGVSEASLSVLKANTRAVALYQRLGWNVLKEFQSTDNGQPYLHLTKRL
jgi:ribosomal protein S18 acetylase RimI-like enzyme